MLFAVGDRVKYEMVREEDYYKDLVGKVGTVRHIDETIVEYPYTVDFVTTLEQSYAMMEQELTLVYDDEGGEGDKVEV